MSPACPRPVYAANTPLAELRTAELFVVAALRLWVLPYREPAGPHPDWRQGFVCAGIADEGAAGFDALFRIIAATALRPLDVRCRRCAHLGDDEAWLLQIVSLLQQQRRPDAMAILGEWVPPACVRIALAPAEQFAVGLAARSLTLPHRHAEAASAHLLAPSAHASRGLALVQ
jgi:hypothetical protein